MSAVTGMANPDSMLIELLAQRLRARGWTCTPPDPDAVFKVRASAPRTSRVMEPVVAQGSLQHLLVEAFDNFEDGATDYELEAVTGRSHQAISAVRSHLTRKGLLRNSGQTRPNRWGNPATVWVRTEVPLAFPDRGTGRTAQ